MLTTLTFQKTAAAFNTGKRFIISQGGARSGKTIANLQVLLLKAYYSKKNIIISVVSESMPHLKRGALRDFETLIEADGLLTDEFYNKTDRIFKFRGSIIEFFSADDSRKVRGPGRDYLFCNEVNAISRNTFNEMVIRTGEQIIVDYNPVSEFYIHTEVLMRPVSDYEFLRTTYRDNELLNPNIKKEIESRRFIDPNWWKVYGEGEIGMLEGLIFPTFNLVDNMPLTDRSAYGLDFGFVNDETALVNVRINNGELWINELLYQTGITNPEIARFIKGEGIEREDIIGDSAEPKSIEELRRMGIRATGADKGADSIRAGIDWMKSFARINITKRSVNLIKEFRNYKWKVDNNGVAMNVPVDLWNNLIDASRYTRQVFQQPKAKPKVSFV